MNGLLNSRLAHDQCCILTSECFNALRHFDLVRSLVMPQLVVADRPSNSHTLGE